MSIAVTLSSSAMGCSSVDSQAQAETNRNERFETQVDQLRQLLRIPGLSAVIVKDQDVVWARGFGFADQEKQTRATPETLYHIASLTKTFASTLIMQLVEKGQLDLDEPMSRYSSDFKDDTVRIKHLLSHTSEGTPGERYQYSGNRYDHLTRVIEKHTGKSFRESIVKVFLDPLRMSVSVPGHDVLDDADKWQALLGSENLGKYRANIASLAQPYTVYGDGEIIRAFYPPKGIGASAGLLSTVLDLAKYDAALNRYSFLKKDTQTIAWTPFTANTGQPLPHGLGWFVQHYQGHKLIWHYGHWGTGFSATYLKIPEKNLSLILLANNEALSDPFYRTGGIETNAFACTFLRLFVFEDERGKVSSDCERVSHGAITQWLEGRRARARKAIKLSPKVYSAYVGQYELNPRRTLTITLEGDRLFIDVPRGEKSEMFAESETEFFLKVASVKIRIVKDQDQVSAIELEAEGQSARARKIK